MWERRLDATAEWKPPLSLTLKNRTSYGSKYGHTSLRPKKDSKYQQNNGDKAKHICDKIILEKVAKLSLIFKAGFKSECKNQTRNISNTEKLCKP